MMSAFERKYLIYTGLLLLIFMTFVGYSIVGSSVNLEYVKEHAEETAVNQRLKIIGYEGWQRGFKGARVWYHFERVPANGILYQGAFQKRPFSDEIHLYNFKAIDAIKPVN
jgi:hypothetical protein